MEYNDVAMPAAAIEKASPQDFWFDVAGREFVVITGESPLIE